MKKIYISAALLCAVAFPTYLASCKDKPQENKLVILHTNDTHSQIDPGDDGLGGVMRRKAVIDSIRKVEPNVLVVDAGDAVQGTLYFYLYGGKVEQEVMNILGVDMRILGNHEFDNGIDSLATILKESNAVKLASNYKLDNTPLAGMFQPYEIKEFGGKKIAFLGINLNPDGIVAKGNYDGLEYMPIVATANLTAEKLKKEEKVDAVVVISHIGYNPAGLVGDSVLAANSSNIDIIIGGHSHDTIDPTTEQGYRRSHMTNLDGKPVLVVQTGKAGRRLGKIEINLDSLGLGAVPAYELIPIDGRYDGYNDPKLAQTLAVYSAGLDSLITDWIGTTEHVLKNREPEQINFLSDFVKEKGEEIAGKIDLAIVNKGSLRADIPAGKFSKGHILNMEPFQNYITIVELKGSDLASVFDVMATTDGNGVSDNVRAVYSKQNGNTSVNSVTIDGKAINPNATYRVATLDYLANGGDYMTGFTHGKTVAQSKEIISEDLINYFTKGKGKGKVLQASPENRWTLEK